MLLPFYDKHRMDVAWNVIGGSKIPHQGRQGKMPDRERCVFTIPPFAEPACWPVGATQLWHTDPLTP